LIKEIGTSKEILSPKRGNFVNVQVNLRDLSVLLLYFHLNMTLFFQFRCKFHLKNCTF